MEHLTSLFLPFFSLQELEKKSQKICSFQSKVLINAEIWFVEQIPTMISPTNFTAHYFFGASSRPFGLGSLIFLCFEAIGVPFHNQPTTWFTSKMNRFAKELKGIWGMGLVLCCMVTSGESWAVECQCVKFFVALRQQNIYLTFKSSPLQQFKTFFKLFITI